MCIYIYMVYYVLNVNVNEINRLFITRFIFCHYDYLYLYTQSGLSSYFWISKNKKIKRGGSIVYINATVVCHSCLSATIESHVKKNQCAILRLLKRIYFQTIYYIIGSCSSWKNKIAKMIVYYSCLVRFSAEIDNNNFLTCQRFLI